jgi:hypothetical protein
MARRAPRMTGMTGLTGFPEKSPAARLLGLFLENLSNLSNLSWGRGWEARDPSSGPAMDPDKKRVAEKRPFQGDPRGARVVATPRRHAGRSHETGDQRSPLIITQPGRRIKHILTGKLLCAILVPE